MSIQKHLEHSVNKLTAPSKLNAVERTRKLKSLQVTENKLKSHISKKKKEIRECEAEINSATNQLNLIVNEKAVLESLNDGMPLITEHAILRYVERQMGVDLNEVVKKIHLLPADEMIKQGNTIVTVLTDDNDHWNLAEREKE